MLKFNGNFKYLINVEVMQKLPGGMEGGFQIEGSCFWNSSTDGQSIVKFEHEHFYVFIILFGIAL